MKTKHPGKTRYPKLYRHFETAQDIADAINRSRSYVFKALQSGFTDREKEMLESITRERLFD